MSQGQADRNLSLREWELIHDSLLGHLLQVSARDPVHAEVRSLLGKSERRVLWARVREGRKVSRAPSLASAAR
jgi:hypothetical protein